MQENARCGCFRKKSSYISGSSVLSTVVIVTLQIFEITSQHLKTSQKAKGAKFYGKLRSFLCTITLSPVLIATKYEKLDTQNWRRFLEKIYSTSLYIHSSSALPSSKSFVILCQVNDWPCVSHSSWSEKIRFFVDTNFFWYNSVQPER